MNLDVNFLSRTTRILLSSGIILLIIGYLVRWLNLYYCWESKQLGYLITFLGIVFLFIDWNKGRKEAEQRTLFTKLLLILLVFVFSIQVLVLIVIPNSGAYHTAKVYVQSNEDIIAETGKIKNYGVIPNGAIEYKIAFGRKTGKATIRLTVKGTKAYKDLTIQLNKQVQSGWAVEWAE